jgi:hypothetical protein
MADLTKITTPFGLLDKETQAALKAHEGEIEIYYYVNGWRVVSPSFFITSTYRAKPLDLPEWPTGLLPEWKWIAKDSNGQVYAYKEKPERLWNVWEKDWEGIRIDHLIPISFDGIPWKQAIIQRPEGV